MITMWSKLAPVGAAEALGAEERSIRLASERATRTLARFLLFGRLTTRISFATLRVSYGFRSLQVRDRSVPERRNQTLLDKHRAPLSAPVSSGIKRVLILYCVISDSVSRFQVPFASRVLRIVVAGFIHLNRESMLG